MGRDLGTTPPAVDGPERVRCPACAAVVRPGAPWCTQCYLDLRAERPGREPAPAVPTALPVPVLPAGEPSWPCTACGSANALAADACAACGSPFLAGLRGTDPPLLVLPGVGDVAALTRARRLGLAAAVALLVVVAVLVLGLL